MLAAASLPTGFLLLFEINNEKNEKNQWHTITSAKKTTTKYIKMSDNQELL